jgi:hypothetical protein
MMINLVLFPLRLIFDTKLNFVTCYLTLKFWLKNPGWFVRNEQNNDQLILVDPVVDDEDPCPQTSDLQTIDNAI